MREQIILYLHLWAKRNMKNNIVLGINGRKYQVLDECLGAGTFGEVYKGINMDNGSLVAVKVANKNDHQIATNQFNILTLLNQNLNVEHEQNQKQTCTFVLKLFGNYRSYNQFYIVTQLFGQSFDKIMSNFSNTDYKFILTQFLSIVKSIQPLRQAKILHRDIKPANILVQYNSTFGINQYKMCDFGLASLQGDRRNRFESNRVGTLIYQSPEVLKFKQYSEKSQLWSLGIILFQLLYKKLPYQKQHYKKSQKLYNTSLSNPIQFVGIPPSIAKLGQKCLCVSLNKRLSFNQLKNQTQIILHNIVQITQKFKHSQLKVKQPQKLKVTLQKKSNISTNTLPHSSLSDLSALSSQTNQASSRKASIELTQKQQASCNEKFSNILIRLIKELETRIDNLKKPKKQFQQKLSKLLQKITHKISKNKSYLHFFNPQLLLLLLQSIKKLKLVCEYSENDRQICFNLKQFMLLDTEYIIYQVINKKAQNISKNIIRIQQHLTFAGQAKPIQFYKELREAIVNFE